MKQADVVCKAGTPEWLAARNSGIGASEMATLLGLGAAWAPDELTLYARKVGAVEEAVQSERMEIGLEMEPLVMRLYSKRSGRHAQTAQELLRSGVEPWALATLDGWTRELEAHVGDAARTEPWPLELKTTSAYRDEDWAKGAPAHVVVQVNQQMFVTGTEYATVACLIGGQKLAWVDVVRDERLVDEIVRAGRLFWKRIEEKRPPKPGAKSTDVLRQLFPGELPGKQVALGNEALELALAYKEYQATIKQAEVNLEAVKNMVRATMGDAEEAQLPDGSRFTWKTVHKSEYVVKAKDVRELRFYGAK